MSGGDSYARKGSESGIVTVDAGENPAAKAPRLSSLKGVSSRVRDKLKAVDINKDGIIDGDEMVNLVEALVDEERTRKMFMWISMLLAIAMCIIIGVVAGLTYGIVRNARVGDVTNNMLVDKVTQMPIQVASTDTYISNGALVARGAHMNNSSSNATAVIKTASYTTEHSFSSRVPIRALMELRYLFLNSPSGAELVLSVWAVARFPATWSKLGSVVNIMTPAGTIILDDRSISFKDEMAPLFQDAGFELTPNNRKLAGAYDVIGFFSMIEDLTIFNLPELELKPRLPAGDLYMMLKVYEPCSLEIGVDRCTKAVNFTAITNATSEEEARGEDLPGVEIVDNVKYMTHMEYVFREGPKMLTMYSYSAWEDMVKYELADNITKTVHAWMTSNLNSSLMVAEEGDRVDYMCRTYPMPKSTLDSLSEDSNIFMEWIGNEMVMDQNARHFRLYTSQPGMLPNETWAVTVDYYDSASPDNTPLRLIFSAPDITIHHGNRSESASLKVMIDFLEVKAFNESSFIPTGWDELNRGTCIVNPATSSGVRWIEDAFTLPEPIQIADSYTTSGNTTRRLQSLFGGSDGNMNPMARTPSSHRGAAAIAAHLLGDGAVGNRRRMQDVCGTGRNTEIPLGKADTLDMSISISTGGPEFKASLSFGSMAYPYIKVGGSLSFSWCGADWDTAQIVAEGCVNGGLTAAPDPATLEILGDNFSLGMEGCLSVDTWTGMLQLEVSQTANVGVGTASLAAFIKMKPRCKPTTFAGIPAYKPCIWLESVILKVSAGLMIYGLGAKVSLVHSEFLGDRVHLDVPPLTGVKADISPPLPEWYPRDKSAFCRQGYWPPSLGSPSNCPAGTVRRGYGAAALCISDCPRGWWNGPFGNADPYCYQDCKRGGGPLLGFASKCAGAAWSGWWLKPFLESRPVMAKTIKTYDCGGNPQSGLTCYEQCDPGWRFSAQVSGGVCYGPEDCRSSQWPVRCNEWKDVFSSFGGPNSLCRAREADCAAWIRDVTYVCPRS